MKYLPEISKSTCEARSHQFYRLNDEQAMDMLNIMKTDLFTYNPGLALFVHTLVAGLFDPVALERLNKASDSPEEFSMRIHFGTLIIIYIILDMINSQSEANEMEEQY